VLPRQGGKNKGFYADAAIYAHSAFYENLVLAGTTETANFVLLIKFTHVKN
jgi:hypothetical protein